MARIILYSALAAVLGLAATASTPRAAALIDPFARNGVEVQDPEDWNLLKQSVRQVLSIYKEGAVASWSGKSGQGGQSKILRVYEQRGMHCAEVEHVYTTGPGTRYALPFCQVGDGTWKLAL